MKLSAIRQLFLAYFQSKGHTLVPSSPTVPNNDPTLMFTTAGMVPFKDFFLGTVTPSYPCATSSQACLRAGGKHNDLENVGYTPRHHTFFEMLGNFSFGDYFKREAIQFAWDFLTKELKLNPEKLWVTVYEDDDEAADIWLNEMGISPERFSRCGAKDNFWSMGDTGPCGPCSEIYYDHGAHMAGGPPGCPPEEEGDRYVEIWNLVFMQFEKNSQGQMNPLPMKAVDTGMGLERISAVMQGVHSNYDTDLFQILIKHAANILEISDLKQQSLKVIADHIRACSFLIADGILPSNEGRGYVLRRIMRRALRHGYQLGARNNFFYKMVAPLVKEMGTTFPRLVENQNLIEKIILKEEAQFTKTLESGMKLLDEAIAGLNDATIPGDVIFKLYDTYGFPVDLTADIARERNLSLDETGFETLMQTQKNRARESSQFSVDYTKQLKLNEKSEFTGYDSLRNSSKILALLSSEHTIDQLNVEQQGAIILEHSPFYAESGGQQGDTGTLSIGDAVFKVQDTQKSQSAIIHHGFVQSGSFKVGQVVEAQVDASRRQSIALNHTATHLLHAALRQILGTHVIQKGSLVAPDRLRFDFAHHSPLSETELEAIEDLVNQKIRADLSAQIEETDAKTAEQKGAMALFGEKYGNTVRMLSIGEFSVELCGGTHADKTGEIGVFKIISETGIANGIRRVEAITGEQAILFCRNESKLLKNIALNLKTDKTQAAQKLAEMLQHLKALERENSQLKQKMMQSAAGDWKAQAKEIQGIKFLALNIPHTDAKQLRSMVDDFKAQFKPAIVVLSSVTPAEQVLLLAGVTPDVSQRCPAGELVNFVAQQVGGKGGGRPEFAQAGGNQPENLQAAIDGVEKWVLERL